MTQGWVKKLSLEEEQGVSATIAAKGREEMGREGQEKNGKERKGK